MKILLNKAYGGFSLSKEFIAANPKYEGQEYGWDLNRTDPGLIKAVEEFGLDTMPDLKVVDIPGDVTDWEMNEYDGWESVTYVVNGKLGHC